MILRRLPALLLSLMLVLPAAGQTVPRTRDFRPLCDTLAARLKRRTTVDFRLSVSRIRRNGSELDLTFNANLSYFPWHDDDVQWFREQLRGEWSFQGFTPGRIRTNGYELDELVTLSVQVPRQRHGHPRTDRNRHGLGLYDTAQPVRMLRGLCATSSRVERNLAGG